MSKVNSEEKNALNISLNIDQNTDQLKKLRFHPYYYQGRKGTLITENRKKVKIVKIEKNEFELILTLSINKSTDKIELKCFWDQINFDYYSISNSKDWKITFSKK